MTIQEAIKSNILSSEEVKKYTAALDKVASTDGAISSEGGLEILRLQERVDKLSASHT